MSYFYTEMDKTMKVCSTGESTGKRLFFLKFAVGKKLTEIKIDVNVSE